MAAAAAHDLNNELTVILNSVTQCLKTLETDSPERKLLLELEASAQRCVWKASGLLHYSARGRLGPVRASFERLIGL